MIGALPEVLSVGGEDYPIRTDFRNVLDVFEVLSDPELDDYCKNIVMVYMMFEDFQCADDVLSAVKSGFDMVTAIKQIFWFISAGRKNDNEEKPTYSWEQDEQIIFSAVNKVAGQEVRGVDYMHWWTFLGYFNEVEEGVFTHIVNIRKKINENKKLETWEKEFYHRNRELIILKKKLTAEEEQAEKEEQELVSSVLG